MTEMGFDYIPTNKEDVDLIEIGENSMEFMSNAARKTMSEILLFQEAGFLADIE